MANSLWIKAAMIGAGLVATIVACKPVPVQNLTGYIIGKNDIEKISPSHESIISSQILDSIVLISTRLGDGKINFCSGALVHSAAASSAPRILTNHHCFAMVDGGNVSETWIEQACTFTQVHFRFRDGNAGPVITANCAEGSLISDFEADVAKFELREPLPADIVPLKFIQRTESVSKRTPALIIQHPDIAENYDYLVGVGSLPKAAIATNCEILGKFSVQDFVLDHTIPYGNAHNCDLIHGGSGSPLLVLEDGEYRIAGTNWGGIKRSETDLYNVATSFEFINHFLDGDTQLIKERNAQTIRSLDASIAKSRRDKERSATPQGKIEQMFCGVVGSSNDQGEPWWLMFVVLALPVFLVLIMRGRDHALLS